MNGTNQIITDLRVQVKNVSKNWPQPRKKVFVEKNSENAIFKFFSNSYSKNE